jgi:hypothetical protein
MDEETIRVPWESSEVFVQWEPLEFAVRGRETRFQRRSEVQDFLSKGGRDEF